MEQREREVLQEQVENEELNSAELEIKRLRAAQEDADRRGRENVTLNDLFSKYNI